VNNIEENITLYLLIPILILALFSLLKEYG